MAVRAKTSVVPILILLAAVVVWIFDVYRESAPAATTPSSNSPTTEKSVSSTNSSSETASPASTQKEPPLPDGTPLREQKDRLLNLQRTAKSKEIGAWGS